MRLNIRKMTLISVLIAQAMILAFIERSIPLNMVIPGVKLGLANIITLISLFLFPLGEVVLILVGRILLTSFMFGSVSSFLFSFAGGMFALIIMYLSKKYFEDFLSIIGISILGAIFHNLGQVLMAALIVENIKVLYYLPFLLIAGIPTGFLIGITSKLLIRYLKVVQTKLR